MRRWSCALSVVLLGMGGITAQDALKSGPQAGALLPAAFDVLMINGKVAEGRQHCLICQNALNPAVLVFTKEPTEKSEKMLTQLLTSLDKLTQKHDKDGLASFAVFLSPDARSSVTDTERGTSSTDALLEEATKRFELIARLKKQSEPLKNLLVAAYPVAGPKGYNINPKADVTVVFFSRLKVVANWAFAEGKLAESDIDAIGKKVESSIQEARGKKKN